MQEGTPPVTPVRAGFVLIAWGISSPLMLPVGSVDACFSTGRSLPGGRGGRVG